MTHSPRSLGLPLFGTALAACHPGESPKEQDSASPAVPVDTGETATDSDPCSQDSPPPPRVLETQSLVESTCEAFGWTFPVAWGKAGGVMATVAHDCPETPDDGGAVFLFDISDPGSVQTLLSVMGATEDMNLGARFAVSSGDGVRGQPLLAASWVDGVSGWTIGGTYVWEGVDPDPVATIQTPDFFIGGGLVYGTDLLVAAAPFVDDRAGRLYVYGGSQLGTLGPEDAVAVHEGGGSDALLGYNMHTAGDLDGDGRADFVVDDGGVALLWSAADAEVDQGIDYAFAVGVSLPLGDSVADVGDWDGDGLDDVALGDHQNSREPGFHVGVFSWTRADAILYFYPGLGDHTEIGDQMAGRSESAGLYLSGLASVSEGASIWLVEPPACGVTTLAEVGARLETPSDAPDYIGEMSAFGDLLILGRSDPDLAVELTTVPEPAAP